MLIAFCPICGGFSWAYDPEAKIYRCYTIGCGFPDRKREYGEGLPDNPLTRRGPDGLEIKVK